MNNSICQRIFGVFLLILVVSVSFASALPVPVTQKKLMTQTPQISEKIGSIETKSSVVNSEKIMRGAQGKPINGLNAVILLPQNKTSLYSCKGDTNGDRRVDNFDIDSFFWVFEHSNYTRPIDPILLWHADMDDNIVFNQTDINEFVNKILFMPGPCP